MPRIVQRSLGVSHCLQLLPFMFLGRLGTPSPSFSLLEAGHKGLTEGTQLHQRRLAVMIHSRLSLHNVADSALQLRYLGLLSLDDPFLFILLPKQSLDYQGEMSILLLYFRYQLLILAPASFLRSP